MELGLKNRVALVAASSKGLGKAVAWGLAREGTKLVICSRNKDVLEKTADDIFLETGVSVFPLAVDLHATLLRNQRKGEIQAEARFVCQGRRVCVVRTRVTGNEGQLLAEVTTTHIPA